MLGSQRNGFTLIEVMLALSIFALAALAAVKTATENVNTVTDLQDKTLARYVAANRMTALGISERWPPRDNQTGTVENGGREWFWRQDVSDTQVEGFRAVTIRVSDRELEDEDEPALFVLTRYMSNSR